MEAVLTSTKLGRLARMATERAEAARDMRPTVVWMERDVDEEAEACAVARVTAREGHIAAGLISQYGI
jgi:hypothetical protein